MTIAGEGFGPAGTPVTLTIGGVPGLAVEVLNDGTLTFVTPPLPAGVQVDIVINIPGHLQTTLVGAYLPIADPAPTAGPTDTDSDGMPDEWEMRYGLDPTDPGDAGGDPDGDGRTNVDEYTNSTHPTATFKRYFAEGLNHPDVVTMLAIANSGPATTRVRISFFRQNAAAVTHDVTLAGRTRLSLDTKTIPGLANAAFGIEVEANERVAVDRTMSWNFGGQGSTMERAVEASTSWYFAEGATTGGFSLFYLLTNPQPVAASATIHFLPQVGAPVDLAVVVPAFARITIPVNTAVPSLASADLGAIVTADRPIVAERSMYLTRDGQTWIAGTAGTGLTQPATRLYFAEGASGDFFDAWLLLSNPGSVDATVTLRYVADNGTDATTTHTVPAGRRLTVRVPDDVPALYASSFATTVTSTNGVPVVAERAMWWQTREGAWSEGHVGIALETPGVEWATADGLAAADGSSDSFVLIANTSAQAGTVKLTALFQDGTAPVERTRAIAATNRITVRVRDVFPEAVGKRFSIVVESVGSAPVPLVVDHSIYWNLGNVMWDAGSSAPATRIR